MLFLGFRGRGVGFGVGGDFGKVDVFAVGEVGGGFGGGWVVVVVGFGVHGGFVGGLWRVGSVGKGDFAGGIFGHVVGASWLARRLVLLVLLVGLVDGGGFVEGRGCVVCGGGGRGCGVVITEDGRLDGILCFVSRISMCSFRMPYLADIGLPNGRSHCRPDNCLLHLLILRPPSFTISLLITRPPLHTRRPYRLFVNFRLENSLDRWPRRVWGGMTRARSSVILHRMHS